ncbi:tetratricopeptide repeat protein [Nostoc sp. ChiSLP03a]|uniref:tetratricopeptide repeat protein n=1 Tax=Nostoc sp. ChiSLP03a TaxID=3075380 RepID=UPI002AD264F8|nr:tetratricopeptide repeat protein [Nostoc sp. ChiSLP03a]MDZ8214175.1 tetratricopeptide repeat protein [Nostoc sp. ChiSLP03a]
MARVSYGDDVKTRVRLLLDRLLAYANDEIENGERFKIDFNWQTPKQLVVRTQLRVLAELGGLKIEQVRDALKALAEFLGVLEDLREHKRGSEDWHFRLTLWCDKGDKDGNLKKFDAEWQRRREELLGVQRAEARKAKPKPTFYENIPLSGVVEFVGREVELQNFHQLLQKNEQVAIAAVAGMGGVGKTELALQYARNHRETYKGGICWLLAKSGDVGIQVVQFAITYLDLKLPEGLDVLAQVQYCWRHWREGDVLLVLDDVGEYQQVKPYLPSSSSRFKVLITTRQRLGASIKQLSLDVLQPEAALELLKSFLKETPQRIEQELAVANQLCERLGYLPLGLELVGRYLKRKVDVSLTEMLRRLEKKRLEKPAWDKPEGDMTAQRGVLAAFELSWQELNDDDKQLGCLLSLFAAAPISWNLVEQCLPESDEEELEDIRDEKLLNLHLLQRKDEGIYQLHPLLREFFQYKLTGLEQAEELKRSFCKVMVAVAKEIPETLTPKQITAVTPAISHIAEVANNLIQYVSDDDLILPFMSNSRFYEGQGLYEKAAPWLEESLKVTKQRLGEEHSFVAVSLNNLAELYYSQGRYSEAEPLYLQALELSRRLLGEEDPNVALIVNNLVALYNSQGKYSEAESLLLQALELTRLLGEEDANVIALNLTNLAELYRSQGRYSEAEPLCMQVLELTRGLLGEKHPNVAKNLNNLAVLYYSQGRYSEAEPLYLQALELTRGLLGEEHPNVAESLNNLAQLYCSQGRYSEAEPLLVQVLELTQRVLGKKHPNVALSLNNLAVLYYSQGRYSEAELLYLQVLELWRGLLGEEHPNVALNLNNLAQLYHSQGRYSEAEPLSLQALELTRLLLGEEHPNVAQNLNNLATIYNSQGRYAEAEPLLLEALQLRRRLLGEEHPNVATTLNNLAALYNSQGRYNEAEPLYLQTLELWRRLLGEEHPNVALNLNNLGQLYSSQGRYSEAEPLLLEALELRRRLFGESHPNVATSLNNLALLYQSQGRYSEAEPLYLQALDICERLLGVNHHNTVIFRKNLARLRDRLSSQ